MAGWIAMVVIGVVALWLGLAWARHDAKPSQRYRDDWGDDRW